MQKYQPFLIAPFKTGLDTDEQPWLLPQDAFANIENGHIHHGMVEKRSGYRFLGDMVHGRPITAATNANPAVFTVASAAGLADGQIVSLSYLSGGTWSTLNALKYTVTGLAGANFSLLDSTGTAVDGTTLGAYAASSGRLGTFEGLRIMGIFRYIAADGTRVLLISDTQRVAIYNAAANLFEPLDLRDPAAGLHTDSDVWASTDLDYIWAANWQHAGSVNRVYFTNGKAAVAGAPGTDGIVYYDASAAEVNQFQPALNATDTLYGSKLLFSIRQRLVCLYTFEFNGASTESFPQRARWCAAQNPSNWNDTTPGGGDFVDAPTGDHIISARALQDQLIVTFTDSVWTLRPLSNPALPFRWDKINDFRACDGKMASVGYDRTVVSLGQRGIIGTDGVQSRRVDDRIQDFTDDDINDDEFGKVFCARSYQNTRTWFLYPREESDDANAALIFDDDSGAFSKYVFAREVGGSVVDLNALGYGSVSADYAAEDFTEANGLNIAAEDLNEETALSFFWSKDAEIFLGGDRAGAVHVLETEGSDNGTSIAFLLDGAGWNPYQEQGVEAQLGYVDFYCDSDQRTKLAVEFSKNDSETPYLSQGMDLLPDLGYLASVASITPNADPTTGFLIVADGPGLAAGNEFYVYGAEGAQFYNDRQFEVSAVTESTISVAEDITPFGNAITGITNANPGVVTSVGHNLVDGDQIYIVAVTGMTEVNQNTYTVANATDDTFELAGEDTTTFGVYSGPSGYAFRAWTSGGQVVELKFFRTKVWKRAYAGGIGFVHQMRVNSEGADRPLRIHAFKPWFRPRGRRQLG